MKSEIPNITGWFANGYRGVVGTFGGVFNGTSNWSRFADWGGVGSVWNYDGADFNAGNMNNRYGNYTEVNPLYNSCKYVIRY